MIFIGCFKVVHILKYLWAKCGTKSYPRCIHQCIEKCLDIDKSTMEVPDPLVIHCIWMDH